MLVDRERSRAHRAIAHSASWRPGHARSARSLDEGRFDVAVLLTRLQLIDLTSTNIEVDGLAVNRSELSAIGSGATATVVARCSQPTGSVVRRAREGASVQDEAAAPIRWAELLGDDRHQRRWARVRSPAAGA